MLNQLRDLDLQLLRLFVTVVESGGFSAAQGELGVGQSTISTQMAKLETRLGFRLCERGKAGFRLTPKGEQVLAATRKLFAAIETFKGEAQGMADMLLGELRIGLSEALSDEVLERIAEAIGRFRQRNQAVQIELLSAMPAELERRLKTLEEDLEQSAERMSERKARIRESVSAVKAVVRADVEGFARRFADQLPGEIEQSDAKDLRKHLGGFIEEKFKNLAEEQAEAIATRLEKVAEEAIAFVTEDASARAEHLRAVLGDDSTELDLDVNTFAYDVGVFAVGAFGVGMQAGSLIVGALAGVITAFILLLTARQEADFLRAEFGPAYEEYEKRVPMFFPKLSLYVEPETLQILPRKLHSTLIDGAFFFLAFPVLELIEVFQEHGLLPVFFQPY